MLSAFDTNNKARLMVREANGWTYPRMVYANGGAIDGIPFRGTYTAITYKPARGMFIATGPSGRATSCDGIIWRVR
jgi:hypothetical protein